MSQHSQTGLHGSRLFVLAWIGVYPMVTLISWLFGEALMTLPLIMRTFVLSGVVVGFMIFLWIPLIQRVERVRNSRRDGSGDGA
jgi:antibiotic biosynthesis monooxygenase (ABM) superfamily enzyme